MFTIIPCRETTWFIELDCLIRATGPCPDIRHGALRPEQIARTDAQTGISCKSPGELLDPGRQLALALRLPTEARLLRHMTVVRPKTAAAPAFQRLARRAKFWPA